MPFPFPGIPLRLSPSGPNIEAENDGDVLFWNSAANSWNTGPPAAGVLAGDTNGLALNNRTTSLSEVGLGVELVPITSLSPSFTEISFLVSPVAGGSLQLQAASVALTGFEGAFDFVLKSRADLLAVPGIGAGPIFNLPSGSYAIKVGFALNAGERLRVQNGVQVLIMGMGGTKVLTGSPGASPLLEVEAGAIAQLYSLVLTTDGAQACDCSGTISSYASQFLSTAVAGGGATLNDGGEWRDVGSLFSCAAGTGFLHLGGTLNLSQSQCTSQSGSGIAWTGANAMSADLANCVFSSTGGVGEGFQLLAANASVRMVDCDVRGDGNGASQSAGVMAATGVSIFAGANGAGHALAVSGGNARWVNSFFLPTTGSCLTATGAGAYQQKFTTCDFFSEADSAIRFNAVSADLLLYSCQLDNQEANGDCITVEAMSTLQMVGGRMSTNAVSRGNGIRIEGPIAGGMEVIGVHGEDISTSDASGEGFISYSSGLVRRAVVSGCDTATTCATAINWPAASIPTLGLSIVNNAWDDPSPYSGFTHTSSRVNSKGNLLQTGLMPETPIVP